MHWNNLFFIKRCEEQRNWCCNLYDRLDLWWMLLSDIFTNDPHLQIHKSAEFFVFFFFFFFGLRVQPHMCVPIRAPSLTSCLQEIGYMELEHKLLPLHTHTRAQTFLRVFKLLLELKLRARELSRLLDSRFPRFPFRALKLSFTPSIFPLF